MLIVKGIEDRKDTKLIKQFATYCLSRFLTKSQMRRIVVTITYAERHEIKDPVDKADLSKYEAWMIPSSDSKNHFWITLAKFALNKNAKSPLTKYKKTLKYLAHELVHVKQFFTGEMSDVFKNGELVGTRWHGVDYPELSPKYCVTNPIKAEWVYYESPWELEAYGRTDGLYNMFHDEHGEEWLK
jgi:hypothetical protein